MRAFGEQVLLMDARLALYRRAALEGRDPTCAEETLHLLIESANAQNATCILEIGAGEGLTSIALALETGAFITAIELDATRAARMREHIAEFGVQERIRLIEGSAGEILPLLEGEYDIIFLDGPKAQYKNYFPDCKRLLKEGGMLFSDDILLYGWVRGEPPKKRRMLVEHIREYLAILQNDPDFETHILEYGEGLAVSVLSRRHPEGL